MVRAQLTPSRLLLLVLVLTHAGAAVSVLPLDAPVVAKAVMLLLVLASAAASVRRHALLRSPRSVAELEITDSEQAAVRCADGAWSSARILGTSCVTPLVTTLNLRVEGRLGAAHVLLVPDNIDPDKFRRIRVLLRWARPNHEAIKSGAADDA